MNNFEIATQIDEKAYEDALINGKRSIKNFRSLMIKWQQEIIDLLWLIIRFFE